MKSSKANIAKPVEFVPQEESRFFKYIWPIHRHEVPKFLLTTLLMFSILFIQNVIRAQKDSIVTVLIGPEIIAFLKFWGVMPASILMAIGYVKLITKFKGEHVFYIIISAFLTFFTLFAFWIFPNHETLHFSQDLTQQLIAQHPNFKWFILICSKWGFSLFYIVAELWPNAAFALLFWQFVNSVTTVEESKRFYTLYGLFAQTGIYIGGVFLETHESIGEYCVKLFNLENNISLVSMQVILSAVIVFCIVAMVTFWYLNHHILTDAQVVLKAKKQKMSLKDSIKMVAESRYIRLIALLLICYGIAINLVEGPWKAKASTIYTTTQAYSAFVGGYLKYTGILTIIFVILGSNIVRFLGWRAAAIITPIMVFVTGITFFGVSNFDIILEMLGIAVTSPISIAVSIGIIQNVLSKSSKYTVFDSTKEMSYVPLDDELKTKGKAAVDVVGIKLGKSLSAFLQSLVFIFIPTATLHSISIYLMVIFTVVCVIWIWAVVELGKEYQAAVKKSEGKEG
jgi:AAA family ATP:ADP antiporter